MSSATSHKANPTVKMMYSSRNLSILRLYAVITVMIDNDNAAAAALFMVQLVKKSRLSWLEKIIKEFEI